MNQHVSAGQQLACWIVDIHFDEQRMGCHVNGIGSSRKCPTEAAPRELIERQGRPRALAARRPGVGLRNIDVNTQPVDGSKMKQLFAGRAAGVDERPRIRIPCSDDSIKRRIDLLKALRFFEAAHIRFR